MYADRASRFHILFVCTGNLCRSVIAERLTRRGLATRLGDAAAAFRVASAGTRADGGSPMHLVTGQVLTSVGADADGFASRLLTAAAVDGADLILTAGRDHRDEVLALRPNSSRRAYLLREFTRLTARASPAAAGGTVVDGARRVVADAATRRGRVPYVDPESDEIADPAETRQAFMACAAAIEPLIRQLLDALCGRVQPTPPSIPNGSRGVAPQAGLRGTVPARGDDPPNPPKGQHSPNGLRQIFLTSVRIGAAEERAVLEVLRSGRLTGGERVAEFERRFAAAHGAAHAVAVSNGTTALVAALRAHGIGPGDEVITTALTFAATLNAILEVGATARFADITDDLTIHPSQLAGLVTPRTSALLPVHLYGLPAAIAEITGIAGRHGLAVIEDAAQAHGARLGTAAVGSAGTAAFSLYGTKNITCGEGGIVTASDDEIARRLRLLRNHGMRQPYDYVLPGYNYRLTDLQAAIAMAQLARLPQINASRAANAARLSEGLAGLPGLVLPYVPPGRVHAWHQYVVRVTAAAPINRDQLGKRLDVAGIDARIYYPALVHDYACYRDHPRVIIDATPRACRAVREVLALPVHPSLTSDDIDRIVSCVRTALTDV